MILAIVYLFLLDKIFGKEYYTSQFTTDPQIEEFNCEHTQLSLWFKIKHHVPKSNIIILDTGDQSEMQLQPLTLSLELNSDFTLKFIDQEKHFKTSIRLDEWYNLLIRTKIDYLQNYHINVTLQDSISQDTMSFNKTSQIIKGQCRLQFSINQILYTNIQILENPDRYNILLACKPGCQLCEQENLFNCLVCHKNRIIKSTECECVPLFIKKSQTECISKYQWIRQLSPAVFNVVDNEQIPLFNIYAFEKQVVYNYLIFETCSLCIAQIFNQLMQQGYIHEIHIVIYYSQSLPHCTIQQQDINFRLSLIQIEGAQLNNNDIQKLEQMDQLHSRTTLFSKFLKDDIEQVNQELLLQITDDSFDIQSNVILFEAIENIRLNIISQDSAQVTSQIQVIYLTDYILKDMILDQFNQINMNYSGNVRLTINNLTLQNVSLINCSLINFFQDKISLLQVNTLFINDSYFQNSSIFSNQVREFLYQNQTILNSIFNKSILFEAKYLSGNGLFITNSSFQNSILFKQVYNLWITWVSIAQSEFINSQIVITEQSVLISLNHINIHMVSQILNEPLFYLIQCEVIKINDLQVTSNGSLTLIFIQLNQNIIVDHLLVYDSEFQSVVAIIIIQSSNVLIRSSHFTGIITKGQSLLTIVQLQNNQAVKIMNLTISNITLQNQLSANLIAIDLMSHNYISEIYLDQLQIQSIKIQQVSKQIFILQFTSTRLTLQNTQLLMNDQIEVNGFLNIQVLAVLVNNLFCELSENYSSVGVFIVIQAANITVKHSQFFNIPQILFLPHSQLFSLCILESNTIITTYQVKSEYKIGFNQFDAVYLHQNYIEQRQPIKYYFAFEWIRTIEISDNTILTLSQQILQAKTQAAMLKNNTIIGIDKDSVSTCEYPYLMIFYGGQQIFIDILVISRIRGNYLYMIDHREIHFSNISGLQTHYQGNLIRISSNQLIAMSIVNMTLKYINIDLFCTKQTKQANIMFSLTSRQLKYLTFYNLLVSKSEGLVLDIFSSINSYQYIQKSLFISLICGDYCIKVDYNHQNTRRILLQILNLSVHADLQLFNTSYGILPISEIYAQNTEMNSEYREIQNKVMNQLKYQTILSLDSGETYFHNQIINFENFEFQIVIQNKINRHFYLPSGIPIENFSIYDFKQNIYREVSLKMNFVFQQQYSQLLGGTFFLNNLSCILIYNQSDGIYEIPFTLQQQSWAGFQIVSKFGTIIQFNNSCYFNNFTGYQIRHTSLIFYGKVLKCQFGQIEINTKCLPCSLQQQQYSVERKTTYCKNINTSTMKSVKYGMIELQKGFWRPNIFNDNIEKCNEEQDSCLGGFEVADKLCKYPNIGPLCSECDLFKQYSQNTFFKDQLLQCKECSFKNLKTQMYIILQNILMQEILIIRQSLIILIITQTFQSVIREKIIIRITLRFTIPLKQHKGVVLTSFLILYAQLLSQTINLNFYSIFKIQFNFDFLTFSSDAARNLMNCLFSQYFNAQSWIYAQQFIIFIYYIYVYNACLLFYSVVLKFNHQAYKVQHILISLICIYRYFIIDNMGQLLSVIQPVKISGLYWVQTFKQIKYTDLYIQYSISIFVPYILFITLILMTLLIFKSKQSFPSRKLQYLVYAFLTHRYKSKYQFTEYLSVISAILILLIQNYGKNDEWKGMFLMIVVGQLNFVILNHINPYINEYLNKIFCRLVQLINFQLLFKVFSLYYPWFHIFNYVIFIIIYICFIVQIAIKGARSVVKLLYLERQEIRVSLYQRLRIVVNEKRRQKKRDAIQQIQTP